MAQVVDSIVVEFIAETDQYERRVGKVIALHKELNRTGQQMAAGQKEYADRHNAAGASIAQAEEQTTARVTRTRRKRVDDSIALDRRETDAAKRAAKERADAEIAEAQRSARLSEVARRGAERANAGVPRATNSTLGRTVPREASGQRGIPAAALTGGAEEVAAAKEVNRLNVDLLDLKDKQGLASAKDARLLGEKIAELRYIKSLEREGVDQAEIALKLDERRALVAAKLARDERAAAKHGGGMSEANQFALGATGGRFGHSFGAGAVAGVAVAVGVAVGTEIIRSAVEYGKALDNLSKQLGITTTDLQAYLQIARETGVEQTTLSSAFGQFASNLGRAQQGQEEYSKVFKALGVEIKDFSSAGDALPTVIDRISQLKDPLQRAAIETRLFGEEGRKLDPLLSGGPERVSQLAASLQETGRALSQREIQELDETARKLAEVKNQLSVSFARIVAGNSDAIIGLANSFAALAARVTDAIGKLQQFGAAQIQSGFVSNFASDADKAKARAFQLSTRSGRIALFRDAERREADLLAGNGSFSAAGGVRGIEQQRAAALAAVRREKVDIAQAERNSRTPTATTVQTGTVNPGLISTLGAPNPPKGKSADQAAREEEQRTRQFNDQLAAANAEFLRAQQQLTGSIQKRADIELQLLESATATRLADIESQRKRNVLAGADAKLEQARADELAAAERKAAAASREVIEQERTLDANRLRAALASTLLDAEQTILAAQISMARSTAERRDLELKALANAKEQERLRLSGIIASAKPGSPEAAQANAEMGTLDRRYGAQERDVRFRNRGVLEQYRDSLPRTADQMNDALDSVKVRGLQSLDDAITDSIGKVFQLGGAFGDVANSIISDLIRIGVQRAIIGPLADTLFGGAGGEGAVGGFLGKILGGRAAGGHVVGGVPYMVGERGPEPVVFPSSGKVYPNGALPQIAGAAPQVTVIAPQHFDLTGVVMTEELVGQMEARNRAYANQVAAKAGNVAVQAAPGRIRQVQTLGS